MTVTARLQKRWILTLCQCVLSYILGSLFPWLSKGLTTENECPLVKCISKEVQCLQVKFENCDVKTCSVHVWIVSWKMYLTFSSFLSTSHRFFSFMLFVRIFLGCGSPPTECASNELFWIALDLAKKALTIWR